MKKFWTLVLVLVSAVMLISARKLILKPFDVPSPGYVKTEAKKALGVNLPSLENSLCRYVDPFIGTAAHGHTYPGATLPFGMVQISPDNEFIGWDWSSGYHWYGKKITGFSHKHLSGTGRRDLGDIAFLPVTNFKEREISFSHEKEYAEPGYYGVKLDNGVLAEFTTGVRTAFHRYTFEKDKDAKIIIDLHHDNYGKEPRSTLDFSFVELGEKELGGGRVSKGWVSNQHVYFYAKFSHPYEIAYVAGRAELSFATDKVEVQVGISSVSVEKAKANYAELEGQSFEQCLANATQTWEKELEKIVVEGDNEAHKRVFYTAAYHAYLAPVTYADADGQFRDAVNNIISPKDYIRYSTFSLWDTYRAAHPLYTFTQPELIEDFVKSLLAHYDYRGFLPVWELEAQETFTMIGNHAITVITEAYLKGYRNFDVEKAFEACVKSANQQRRGLGYYLDYDYVPCDKQPDSVSLTLEYAHNDWSLSLFAKALGKEEDAAFYEQRSKNYKNLFNADSCFFQPKKTSGDWKKPFDPYAHKHKKFRYFTEGNGWQWAWYVPHDVEAFIALHPSREAFTQKLNQLFLPRPGGKESKKAVDVTGLIGEYAHGNEPSHHTAYLFNWSTDKAKTAEIVHKICDEFYTDKADGLCGNEDCGQMSAWYVFSAMGFYPVDPVSLEYQLGTPFFDKITMKMPNGKNWVVKRVIEKEGGIVPREVQLNGVALDRTYITWDEMNEGGELTFYLE